MPARRRNWPLRLVVVLVVLAGLFVAVDRIAVAVAQNIAAHKIQDSQHLADTPDVDIAGFPFLTQLAASKYDSVQITAHGVPVGSSARTLRLDTVTVHLGNVTTTRNFDDIRAGSATADARVTFADLAHTLGTGALGSDGPNRLKAAVHVSVAGQTVMGSVSAHVSASDSKGLTFSDIKVSAAGVSVSGAETALGSTFHVPIPLSGLPFDVHVTGVDVDAAGLDVHLSGRDLDYRPS